jgi:hypothetical protein
MVISDQNRRPLGLFVDQATPLLYTSLIETFGPSGIIVGRGLVHRSRTIQPF